MFLFFVQKSQQATSVDVDNLTLRVASIEANPRTFGQVEDLIRSRGLTETKYGEMVLSAAKDNAEKAIDKLTLRVA